MTEQPQTPPMVPIPPDVEAILEPVGEGLGLAIRPLVDLIAARQEAIDLLVPRLVALQQSLTDVLAWLDRAGVRPNWATDVRTLEAARDLLASLEPREDTHP